LDPVADKLLVSTILLMLSGTGSITGIHLIGACVILAREIIVSGLRQFMSEMQLRVPVTKYAKWKTTTQMFSISCLLFARVFPNVEAIQNVGIISLWIAAFMTLFTGVRYLKFGIIRIAGDMVS
jgi:CDP-diacylglycerol--glycerol-3-phosphate 3-phosphatidyltransferase